MNDKQLLSVIIPISEKRYDDIQPLYFEYKNSITSYTENYEFIYILDGEYPDLKVKLKELIKQGEPIKVISLSKSFGEATAISIAFEHSKGDLFLTLPAYRQIESEKIAQVLKQQENCDMVIVKRWPRIDSSFSQIRSRVFHKIVNYGSKFKAQDIGCGVRTFKRKVLEEINLYGDQHRFLSFLAYHKGFKVTEIEIPQSKEEPFKRSYPAGVYLRRLLDILVVSFLVKFTKKPIRFFGLIGSGIFFVGLVSLVYLIIDRLFFGGALADRPALFLSSLMLVLGIQILAIGLIGEIIIFTHAKEMKEYTIAEIIN